MRTFLDALYAVALWLSAACLGAIALLVGAQVVGRLIDNALVLFGYQRYGFIILSLSEMCGFLLGAATFLALAGTLKAGAHIRVTLFLGFLPEHPRRYAELFALTFAAAGAACLAWFIARLAMDSYRFNELSVGLLPIPLWPPQAMMAFGAALLTIAFLDELGRVALGRRPSFRAAEDAIALGKEG
jgi:TRAP-type C4-dicarboxylate transport system permease small subunit